MTRAAGAGPSVRLAVGFSGLLGLSAVAATVVGGCRWKGQDASAPLPGEDLSGVPRSFASLVRRLLPSVVGVHVTTKDQNLSLGSGVIIDADGSTLTNSHVLPEHGDIEVRFFDGHRASARLVGRDEETDVALLKIEAPPGRRLAAAPLGDSDRIEVGEWVVAIGQPFGLSHSVTAGILSAKGRTYSDMQADPQGHGYWYYLQTDAAINPGNSGGPLIDMRGTIVGINTMIHQERTGRIGFAIPITLIRTLLGQLKSNGMITRTWIGVEPQALEPDDAFARKVPGGRGVLVREVRPQSPASRAGLHVGDVIFRFDGKVVQSDAELRWLSSTAGVGRAIALAIWREGREREVVVTMDKKPEDQTAAGRR